MSDIHCKGENYSAFQEIVCGLWNPKVRYRVLHSPPLGHILDPLKPPYFNISFNMSLHVHIGGPTNFVCSYTFSPCMLNVRPSHS